MAADNETSGEIKWQDLLKEQEDIRPENGYVLYLRRSKKTKKKKGKEGAEEEDERDMDRISIEQQREACIAAFAMRQLKIVKVFEEERPAKHPHQREEFDKMLKYLEENPQLGVFAWSPDRLTRNALEAGKLIQMFIDKHIVDFQFVTYYFHQNESGLEYLLMEFARAMGYSLRLRKTVTRGLVYAYHKDKKWPWANKFGYERLRKTMSDGTVERVNFPVPHETKDGMKGEFQAIQEAFRLRREREIPYAKIAQMINDDEDGYYTKKGNKLKLTKQRLQVYLKDPFYYGLGQMKWGDLDLRKEHETDDEGEIVEFIAAVEESDWHICQKINEKRGHKQVKKHDNVPFRGIISCWHCKESIQPQVKGKSIFYYCMTDGCTGRAKHSQQPTKETRNGITADVLFKQVKEELKKSFRSSEDDFLAYLLYIEKQNQMGKQFRKSALKTIAAEKGHIERTMKAATKDFERALNKLDKKKNAKSIKRLALEHEDKIERYEERLTQKEAQAKKLRREEYAWTKHLSRWLELMQNGFHYWNIASPADKAEFASMVFLELEIKEGNMASHKYKDLYEEGESAGLSLNGRDDRT